MANLDHELAMPSNVLEINPLWRPQNPSLSRTFQFLRHVNQKYHLNLSSYYDLWKWSTKEIGHFWSTVWDETCIIGEKGEHLLVVDESEVPADNPLWFQGAKLNWAENMLQYRSTKKVALIEVVEPLISQQASRVTRKITYSELYKSVADVVAALLDIGLQPGDRVASYSSNCIENVIACLATAAIGCIWVSAAADFGPDGVLERFEQVKPKVLFSVSGVIYNGKYHPHTAKLSNLLSKLTERSCEPLEVVVINVTKFERVQDWQDSWKSWDNFIERGRRNRKGLSADGEINFKRLDFNWPLWILFSSGTTGKPKPIVHRAGGMLLQSRKELDICAEIGENDVFFYYTTTGWMMWNFLIAGLSSRCTLVLYDGSPLREPSLLWNLVDDLGITIFGTSAKYLDQLSKVYRPKTLHRLDSLCQIYSTGSPLSPHLFDFVYEHIKSDIILASITGGTDICSLFAGMNTALPVYRGEIQCRMLGMAIDAFTQSGKPAGVSEAGELVCLRPFPCMPVGFWPLKGFGSENAVELAQVRYQQSYFAEFKDVWYHGDHIIISDSRSGNGGGVIMLGRSDSVLNPGGVRFGSSEIYDVLDTCFKFEPCSDPSLVVVDYLAVGQLVMGGADERVILFIKLPEAQKCTDDLKSRIKSEVRNRRGPRYVPEIIVQVQDIPYTLNGKRVEVPVKKIINGAPTSIVNPATLRNPQCLIEYEQLGKQLRAEN